MNLQTESQIAVFFCKHFPAVVKKVRCNAPTFLDTVHGFVSGSLHSMEGIFGVALTPQGMAFIDAMTGNGYTVTAYVRVSDSTLFTPFSDEFETLIANRVNERIWPKAFPVDLAS